jgi:hypothetical protein
MERLNFEKLNKVEGKEQYCQRGLLLWKTEVDTEKLAKLSTLQHKIVYMILN